MKTEILTALFGIGGVIVGGLVTFIGTVMTNWLKTRQEKKALESAILTEISVVVEMIKSREYIPHAEQILQQLRDEESKLGTFRIHFPDNPFPIFSSNLSKISLLSDTVRNDVVRFYKLLEAVISDVRPDGPLANEGGKLRDFEVLVALTKQALEIGKRLNAEPVSK